MDFFFRLRWTDKAAIERSPKVPQLRSQDLREARDLKSDNLGFDLRISPRLRFKFFPSVLHSLDSRVYSVRRITKICRVGAIRTSKIINKKKKESLKGERCLFVLNSKSLLWSRSSSTLWLRFWMERVSSLTQWMESFFYGNALVGQEGQKALQWRLRAKRNCATMIGYLYLEWQASQVPFYKRL